MNGNDEFYCVAMFAISGAGIVDNVDLDFR